MIAAFIRGEGGLLSTSLFPPLPDMAFSAGWQPGNGLEVARWLGGGGGGRHVDPGATDVGRGARIGPRTLPPAGPFSSQRLAAGPPGRRDCSTLCINRVRTLEFATQGKKKQERKSVKR